ncbi:hypothetical protein [Sphingomonas zeicaulis]|uniref:hypothetical protein n=1 Tax=Sphingomonas zeicaulis TaxID=1632740 RepID=UPI003D21C07D
MRRLLPLLAATALAALGGCDRGQAPIDIVSVERLPLNNRDAGVDLQVDVRAGQFRNLIDLRGTLDLKIAACSAPDGPADRVPVLFGHQDIARLSPNQIADDPDTLVRLNATVSRRAAALPDRCVFLVEGSGRPYAPRVTSRMVPLPAA